ncbi:MAG: penicillin-binding protein 2 [Clostridia bacterium]|nr:penicillin-binding protein 2 [Clostridia bacterium]
MSHKKSIAVLYILIMTMFVFVIFRLYSVTFEDKAAKVLSGQYSRKITVAERRGFIYDRNGEYLNKYQKGYILAVNPKGCSDLIKTAEDISLISNYSQSQIYDKLLTGVPFTVTANTGCGLEGVYSYPIYEEKTISAPHIVGYTNSEGVGVAGIEKHFDTLLSGNFSGEVIYRYMSDVSGVPLENTGNNIYDTGYSETSGVYLTIDKKIQKFCREIAEKYIESGAICVSNTNTGEILACVSLPDFDTERIADYLESSRGELINRCTVGFTPGSVFKTVVAASALELDKKFYDLEYECTGSIETEDGDILPCHNGEGHGRVTMTEAYAQSCNPYFINLALVIGDEIILETARKMGLSKNGTLDGIFSYSCNLPEYSPEISSESGYTANLAIGQGKTLVSPVSLCTMFSCAVTGNYVQPGIILKITDGDNVIRNYSNREKAMVLSEETTEKLSLMMRECIENGLGVEAKPTYKSAGGKTATAQSGRYSDEKEILNCWFCGVYPHDIPEYTICVLSCGTENSKNAKVVFRKICDFLEEM